MTYADQHGVYLTHEEHAALLAERDRLRDECEGALAIIATERAELLKLRAERDRLRDAIAWASVITSHGMGLSTNEERTLHSVLTSALKGDQT